MSKHRVVITGASGFVGAHLTKVLSDVDGCEVFGWLHGDGASPDIRDPKAVAAELDKISPTALVHLAAVAAPIEARRSPRHAWDVNVIGTLNCAEALSTVAPSALFVYVGSSEAYGASFLNAKQALCEDAGLNPLSTYGATKAAADLMIGQMVHGGLRAVRFRPFNHTGPGQGDTYVVSAFARQVAGIMRSKREPVISVGNLDAERDFLDVRDVVRAYAAAALSSEGSGAGDCFNLASGRALRISDILNRLVALSGRDISVETDPARLRPNEIARTLGDASAARRRFGWQPEIDFQTTLSDVLEFWLQRDSA